MIEDILREIEGATIATSFVEDEQGFHICLQDGRILVISGFFAVAVLPRNSLEKLH